jgi:hypothetical protein
VVLVARLAQAELEFLAQVVLVVLVVKRQQLILFLCARRARGHATVATSR